MPADKATQRSHAYALLRSLFEQAIDEGSLAGPNPCAIRGAGVTRRRREIRPASLNELAALVDETQEHWKPPSCWRRGAPSASGRCSNCAATTSTWRLERSTSGERSFASIGSRPSVGRNRTPASGPSPYPRTFSPLSSIISNATSGKHRNALLFTTVHGQYWTHGNFYKAAWIPTRTAATKSWTPFLDMPRSDVDCVANVRSFRHAQTPVEVSVLTGGAEAVAGGERVGCAVHRQPVSGVAEQLTDRDVKGRFVPHGTRAVHVVDTGGDRGIECRVADRRHEAEVEDGDQPRSVVHQDVRRDEVAVDEAWLGSLQISKAIDDGCCDLVQSR